MKQLLVLHDKIFQPNAPKVNRNNFYQRRAARAVVLDESGAVGLLHVTKESYFKLPGGGIDDDEEITEALQRELLEELGCRAEIMAELGQVLEYRDYWQMVQTSYTYIAQLVGTKGHSRFTDLEHSKGFTPCWQPSIEAAIEAIETQQPHGEEHPLGYAFMQARDIAILKAAGELSRVLAPAP